MEIEFKLPIPAGQAAGIEQRMLQETTTSVRLRARYFDTAGQSLRQAGITLRLRQEGKRWVQNAKFAGDSVLMREEDEVDVCGVHEPAPERPDPALHAGTPVGKRLAKALRGKAEGGGGDSPPSLRELFSTDIERLTQIRRVNGSSIELALDRGEVRTGGGAGQHAVAVEELELELKSGEVADLAALALEWSAGHGLWISTESKAAKGWSLVDGPSPRKVHPVAGALPARRQASGAALLRALVGRCLGELLPHAGTIASGGGDDDEAVHQLRVGLRRLRTVLRELAGLAPLVDPAWEPALADAFARLGQWRDRSNMESVLLPELAAQGAPALSPDAAGPADLPRPEVVVRAAGLQQALISLMAFSASTSASPEAEGLDPKRARAHLRRRLSALHEKLQRAAGVFENASADEQHRARKQLKRLRYLVEFVGPLFDDAGTGELIKRLKPAQDALGLLNEEAMAGELMAGMADRHPQAWFAVGWFSARREGLVKRGRGSLKRALKHRPFWE